MEKKDIKRRILNAAVVFYCTSELEVLHHLKKWYQSYGST